MMSANQISNNLPEQQSHLWTDTQDESVRAEFESLLDSITAFASSVSADGETEPELNPKGREIVPILPNQNAPVIIHSEPETPVAVDHSSTGVEIDAPVRDPEVHEFPVTQLKITPEKINWERGQRNLTPQLERQSEQVVRADTPPIFDPPNSDDIGTAELPEFEEFRKQDVTSLPTKNLSGSGNHSEDTKPLSLGDQPYLNESVEANLNRLDSKVGSEMPPLNSPVLTSQAGQVAVTDSSLNRAQTSTLNSRRVVESPFQPTKSEPIKGETFEVMSTPAETRSSGHSGNKVQWAAVSDFETTPSVSPATKFATTDKGEVTAVEETAEIVIEKTNSATEESLSDDQFDAEFTGTPIRSEKSASTTRDGKFEIKVSKSDPTIGDKIIDRFAGDIGGSDDAILPQTKATEPVKHVAKSVLSELTNPIENGETKTLKFRLNPEELGEVEVTVSKNDEGKLDITIEVESEFVAKTISDGIEFLKSTISDAGSDVSSLDIFEFGKREDKEKQQTKESSPTDPGNDDMDQQEEAQPEVPDEDRIISYSA